MAYGSFRQVRVVARPLCFFLQVLGIVALGIASLQSPFCAAAEPYPSKPVKLIVGFAAGGATDVIGRAFAQRLSPQLGQPGFAVNRVGARAD